MKQQLKLVTDIIFKFLSWPFFLFYRLQGQVLGKKKAFLNVTQACSLIPGVCGEWFRRGFLQWVTGQPLQDCCICFGSTFSDPRIKIGNGVYIGMRCDIGYATIENDCVIGSGVHILSGQNQHYFDDPNIPIRDQGGEFKQVVIGADTWIGNAAVIAADLGTGCVIGAGSVVVVPVPNKGVAVGNPAQVVKYR